VAILRDAVQGALEPMRKAQVQRRDQSGNGVDVRAPLRRYVATADLARAFDERTLHALLRVAEGADMPVEGVGHIGMRQARDAQALALAFPALLLGIVDPQRIVAVKGDDRAQARQSPGRSGIRRVQAWPHGNVYAARMFRPRARIRPAEVGPIAATAIWRQATTNSGITAHMNSPFEPGTPAIPASLRTMNAEAERIARYGKAARKGLRTPHIGFTHASRIANKKPRQFPRGELGRRPAGPSAQA
jgi:hypothetical protein